MKIYFSLLLIAITFFFSSATGQSIKADSLKVNRQCDMISVIKTSIETGILYNRTIKWVNEYYQNPDRVITGNLENQSITISGFNSDIFNTRATANYGCDMFYHIFFTFKDTIVNYRLSIDRFRFDGLDNDISCDKFYKKDGFIKDEYRDIIYVLDFSINTLLYSYVNKLTSTKLTSEEALTQLKKAKEKLDLQLITQQEYDRIKAELLPFIK